MASSHWSKAQYEAYIAKHGNQKPEESKTYRQRMDGYRNKWEREFGEHVLPCLVRNGGILWYEYEPFKIKLAKSLYIIPDFVVMRDDHRLLIYEVKGFKRATWSVKWKVFKEKYRMIFEGFYVAVRESGKWNVYEI
jgi:hypothetical protein